MAGCLGDDGYDGEYTLDIIDRGTDEEVADYHGHWHGSLPDIPAGGHLSVGADVENNDGEAVALGEDLQLDATVDDTDRVETESHGDHVHLYGDTEGNVDVTFQLRTDDDVEWETSEPISADVV